MSTTNEQQEEELFSININWTSEGEYEPDWRIMSKDRFLYEWGLEQAEWDDMANGGAIKPYPPARQEGEEQDKRFSIISSDLIGIQKSQEGWPTEESQIALRSIREELSAKQAELESLKAAQAASLNLIEELKDQYGLSSFEAAKLELEVKQLKAAQGWRPIHVATVGSDWQIFWKGACPIGEIVRESGVKIGDKLYHLPTPPVERSENKG